MTMEDATVPSVPDTSAQVPRRPPAQSAVPEPLKTSLDTVPPTVYAEPTGGLYSSKIYVNLECNEPCSIFFLASPNILDQIKRENITSIYSNVLDIDKNTFLYFYAHDTAGNISPIKVRKYDINPSFKNPCPKNMVLIFSLKRRFCIDQFEWPNMRYKMPASFVSWYQARDSCQVSGKRLCTSEEWYNACSDFGRTAYPYGQTYEHQSCVTEKGEAQKAGKYHECMSYYGVYDMSGNLQEWTSTKAPQNANFYKVMGGFHSSHSASGCSDFKYSFYPQNQSVTVGFRCCHDP
ncbi:MAG: SUMF1/EgtB/PvdO family nonheme iron enzyme [Elusimicrobiota bacterium]